MKQPETPEVLSANLSPIASTPEDISRPTDAVQPSEQDLQEQQAIELLQQGNLQEAEVLYRSLVSAGSTNPVVYSNLAALCGIHGKIPEMIELLEKTLKIQPDYAQAHYNLGYALHVQGNLYGAIESYQTALTLQPDYAEAYYNLGNALYEIGDLEESLEAYQNAIVSKPDYAEAYKAYNNFANVLSMLGDLNGAIEAYQKSIELKPSYPDAHTNLAMALLLSGDYANGWPWYEARFHRENLIDRIHPHAQPPTDQWDGKPLTPGDQLLVVSEQGLGDTLQFMRYVPYLRDQGIDVSLCAQPKLHGLIQVSGIDPHPYSPEQAEQITGGQWISMLSLPRHLGITPDRPLVTDPYIKPPQERIDYWRQVLAAEQRPIIGIYWQGNPETERNNFRGRSLPLEHFAAIAQGDNVRLLSLQKGYGTEQMETCSFRDRFVTCQDKIDQTWDFVETAAILANCDLIITPDTIGAHLAGGLGKPTWLLLQSVPEWRWGMDTESSFWYPSLRLFRQRERDNWSEVFQRVSQALAEFIVQRVRTSASTILAPISLGELMDKITILEIKAQRIQGAKRENVLKELQALEQILQTLAISIDPNLVDDLKTVNIRIWDTEEAIRQQEHRQDFGDAFIKLARSVYRENDRRAAIKRDINTRYGSALVEEKSYPTLVYKD